MLVGPRGLDANQMPTLLGDPLANPGHPLYRIPNGSYDGLGTFYGGIGGRDGLDQRSSGDPI